MQEKEQFLAFLQHPADLVELQAGQKIFGAKEIQSFLYTIRDRDSALSEFAQLLAQLDDFHASVVALICGSQVEGGGQASIPVEAILELMWRQLQLAETYSQRDTSLDEEATFQLMPEATRAHYGLPFTLLATMTTLCRDKEARKRWQQRQDVQALVEALEETYGTLFYVKEVLSLLDDQELLVLDAANKRGFLVRMEGVRDRMYHCYALLQHAILERSAPGYLGATPTDPRAVRYAQNQGLTPEDHQTATELSDEQRFSFCYPTALDLDGNGGYTLNTVGFFPGSASFFEIPVLQGTRILLIGERLMRFGWQPANMYSILHDALISRVEIVRELETTEVENWLQLLVARTHRTPPPAQ